MVKLRLKDFGLLFEFLLFEFLFLSMCGNSTASSFKFNVLKIKTNLTCQISYHISDGLAGSLAKGHVFWVTAQGLQSHGHFKSSLSSALGINSSSLVTVAVPRSPFFFPELSYLTPASLRECTKRSLVKRLI